MPKCDSLYLTVQKCFPSTVASVMTVKGALAIPILLLVVMQFARDGDPKRPYGRYLGSAIVIFGFVVFYFRSNEELDEWNYFKAITSVDKVEGLMEMHELQERKGNTFERFYVGGVPFYFAPNALASRYYPIKKDYQEPPYLRISYLAHVKTMYNHVNPIMKLEKCTPVSERPPL